MSQDNTEAPQIESNIPADQRPAGFEIEVPQVVDPVTQSAQEETDETVVNAEAAEEGGIEEAAASEGETEEPSKPTGFQKRINELTRKNYEKDAQLQELQQKFEQAQQAIYQIREESEAQQAASNAPRIEDYDYDADAWSQAYKGWVDQTAQEKAQAAKASQEKEARAAQQQQKVFEYQRKLQEAAATHEGFNEKIGNPDLPQLPVVAPIAFEEIMESPKMAEIMLHLAGNPEKAYSLVDMSPTQAIKEIGRMEVMLSSKPVATAAPKHKPVTNVKGSSTSGRDLSKMSTAEYIKFRQEQLYKRRFG